MCRLQRTIKISLLSDEINLSFQYLPGIAHCGVGPVVFYKGFTRAYLRGETPSANVLKQSAVDAVNAIRSALIFTAHIITHTTHSSLYRLSYYNNMQLQ